MHMKNKTKRDLFIVKDWAGNILNYDAKFLSPDFSVPKLFGDFDSAWAYIYSNYKETEFDDLFVEILEKERK